MVDAAVIFGANKSKAEFELLDSLQFEIDLAKVKKPKPFYRYLLKKFDQSFRAYEVF